MLKQFHLATKVFADPVVRVDDNGEPILSAPPAAVIGEVQYTTSGEGWFALHTQAEIDGICASITGNGEVWAEGTQLRYSGRQPDEHHHWNAQAKQWQPLTLAQQQAQQHAQFAEERQQLLRKIADQTDRLKQAKLASYPQTEIDSFYRQEQEARAWLADPTTVTPMLSAMVENYSDMADLCGRIIQKAEYFAALMGKVLATKQAFEKRVKNAQSLAELNQIDTEVAQWQLSI